MMDVVYWVRGQKYADMAALSIASVKAVDKTARCYVYTDEELTVPGAIMAKGTRGPAMVANVEAQLRYLSSAEPGSRILFLDVDVLLRKPFPFTEDASLYVTWRTTTKKDGGPGAEAIAKLMPYNYGVLGAIAGPMTVEAFTWMRNRISQMSGHHQQWYGNQLALHELCGSPVLGQVSNVPVPRSLYDCEPRIRVMRLECDTWNYTPEGPGEDVSDKGALHFKGGRKDLMEAYL